MEFVILRTGKDLSEPAATLLTNGLELVSESLP